MAPSAPTPARLEGPVDVAPARRSAPAAPRRTDIQPTISSGGRPLLALAPWWIALLAAALVLRFIGMWRVVLLPEEAYYWMYWQHPSMSYFDHPPMVAWVIGAGTGLVGNAEFGVRLVGCLLMLASSGLMWWMARRWFDRGAALLSALALQVLPAYYATGFIATMDAPLLFFWMVALAGLTHALHDDRAGGWYLAGVGMGAALLSKYTGIFLGLGGLLAVIGCRTWRHHLRTPHPYLASLLAIAMFTPVLAWNAEHGWASFRFQFVDRFVGHEAGLKTVAEFLAMHLLIATPVVLVALGWLALRLVRRPRRILVPRTWFALCLSMPLLAAMAWKSVRYPIHINWTLPAFLSLMPILAHLSIAGARRLRVFAGRHNGLREIAWTGAVCVAASLAAMAYLILLQPTLGIPREFGRWREMAAMVEKHEMKLEHEIGREPLIVAEGDYRLASVIAFYRSSMEAPWALLEQSSSGWMVDGEGLNYRYWVDPKEWIGIDGVCVGITDAWVRSLDGSFDSVQVIDDPVAAASGVKIAVGRGYRGPAGRPRTADERAQPPAPTR